MPQLPPPVTTDPTPPATTTTTARKKRRVQAGLLKQILDAGMGYIGTPYVWGGSTPGGFDCSGLVQFIFHQHGVSLGRTTYDQVKEGKAVGPRGAQAGDILFFNTDSQYSHEGLYLGNGLMLVAPHTGTTVQIQRVRPQDASAIRRVLPPSAYEGLNRNPQGRVVYHPQVAAAGDYSGGTSAGNGGFAPDQKLTASKALKVSDYLDDPQIAASYGYLAAYMRDPEIGPILAKAAKQGWGANQLLGALSKTKWWKTTSDSARAWQAQQRTDPATARQRLSQMVGQVQQLAQSTLGGKIDPDRARHIANTAIASNWSQNQLQFAIGAEFHYNAQQDAYGGAAGQTLGKLKEMGRDWLVPISNHTLNQWTRGVLEGTYQTNDFESYLKDQAKSLYPTLKSAIDSGVSVRQYLDPYAQLAAQTLEMSPDAIDWMKPKWSKALNTTTPDGQRAPMSLSDWGTYLRNLPDFKKTDGATASVYNLADAMVHQFGKVAS